MKIQRRVETNFAANDIPNIGDQLKIDLGELGIFTATAQAHDNGGTWLLFDECVDRRPMNKNGGNDGGFDMSDLCRWLKEELLPKFPHEIKSRVMDISIPTYGQIFGHDEFYNDYLEPDDDEQFYLMSVRKNRIADYKNEYEWYWLRNATKQVVSSGYFAGVDYSGDADYSSARDPRGVRPAFLLM